MIKEWLIHVLGGRTEGEYRYVKAMQKQDYLKYDEKIKELMKLSYGTPEHCKRGEWCKQCLFVKKIHISPNQYNPLPRELYFCGKGNICPSMIARDAE